MRLKFCRGTEGGTWRCKWDQGGYRLKKGWEWDQGRGRPDSRIDGNSREC